MVHHVNYVLLIVINAKINLFVLNVHNSILLINKINANIVSFIVVLVVKIILIVQFVSKGIISKIYPIILCVLNVQQAAIIVMILPVIDALLDFI